MAIAISPGTQDLLREFRDRVSDLYGDRLLRVILFGSEARGDAGPNSDIDIVLVFQDKVAPGVEITRLGPLLADLNLRFERLVSVVPLSIAQYDAVDELLLWQVRREGIAV